MRELGRWIAVCVAAWGLVWPVVAGAAPQTEVPQLGMSIEVPEGWSGGWEVLDGVRQFVLRPRGVPADRGAVNLQLRAWPASAGKQGLKEVLTSGLEELRAGMGEAVRVVTPPMVRTVEGKEVGHFVLGARMPMPEGGVKELEIFLGMVKTPEWGHAVTGSWERAVSQKFRSGAESVLDSVRVRPIAEDKALAKKVVGCWQEVGGSGGGGGSAFAQTTYNLGADGRFRLRSTVSVAVPGMGGFSDEKKEGRWRAVGAGQLAFFPESGDSFQLPASTRGGGLELGGRRYVPCR